MRDSAEGWNTMSDDIRSIEIMQDNAEHTAEMLDREWAISFDNEAGPGWDYVVVIPGYENIMGLAKEVAERIVDDHNARRAISPPEPTEDAVEKLFEGLDDRLDRLLVNDTDSSRFILSGVSAHNITEIAKEWVRSRLRAMPLQDHAVDVNSREAALWSENMRLRSAIEHVRAIIKDGAMTGFNCHDGN